jgi:hypothetical protein
LSRFHRSLCVGEQTAHSLDGLVLFFGERQKLETVPQAASVPYQRAKFEWVCGKWQGEFNRHRLAAFDFPSECCAKSIFSQF